MIETESERLKNVEEFLILKGEFKILGTQFEVLVNHAKALYADLQTAPDFTDEDRAEVLAFRNVVKTRLLQIHDSL